MCLHLHPSFSFHVSCLHFRSVMLSMSSLNVTCQLFNTPYHWKGKQKQTFRCPESLSSCHSESRWMCMWLSEARVKNSRPSTTNMGFCWLALRKYNCSEVIGTSQSDWIVDWLLNLNNLIWFIKGCPCITWLCNFDFALLGSFYSGARQLLYGQQYTRVILSKKRYNLRKRPFTFIVFFSSPSSQSFKYDFVFYIPNTPLKEPLFTLISAVYFIKIKEHFQQSSWQFSTTDHSLKLPLNSCLNTLLNFSYCICPFLTFFFFNVSSFSSWPLSVPIKVPDLAEQPC